VDRRDFFVSYTASDAGWAEWIAWQLREAGYSVFLQAWDMVPGSNWLYLMNQATMFAERTIAVLSDAYLNGSPFGQAEWLAAYRVDPSGLAGRVLPVRIEDCELEGLIAGIVHVDLVGLPSRDAARERLLDGVRAAIAGHSRPLVEPAFPGPAAAGTPAAARSDYLAQVRQIAPRELVGRDAELAAMTAFCTDAAAGPYVWWRAAAWTGKTALMATWVLHPPPQASVVSFFITARYAGNSDRAAYVEVVNEQLAALVGRSVPPYQTPSAQERLYWSLLSEAAARCQRLVLVVDGLDEDRGVAGPDPRSIAALLPVVPPGGMRIMVAGRPDPKLPDDVPHDHPLRDPAAVWLLRRSSHAAAVRADMVGDLARLRDDVPVGRDVLGLVTAAGGGLTSRDLAELGTADVTDWDIDRLLGTVVGRSFRSRNLNWGGGIAYVLGHEEIQQEAVRSYGPARLAAYRERLHAWAESYRDRGWPAETPEYLLRGYFRLLSSTGDLARAVACATDPGRHDRMLDLSGGDTAALAEITDTQNAILATPHPDLPSMARLAVHRDRITGRNGRMPAGLPEVWARLGQPDRAEQLAGLITDPRERIRALSSLALTPSDPDSARALAARAEKEARAVVRKPLEMDPLGEVATAWAGLGDHDRVLELGSAIAADVRQVKTVRALAATLAGRGAPEPARSLLEKAEESARSSYDQMVRAWLLSLLARSFEAIGDHDHARALRRDAGQMMGSRAGPVPAYAGQVTFLLALAQTGDPGRAETIAGALPEPSDRFDTLITLAVDLDQTGDRQRARALLELARTASTEIAHPIARVTTLTKFLRAATETGHPEIGSALLDDAEKSARAAAQSWGVGRELADLVGALAEAGDCVRAERIARVIGSSAARASALAAVAKSSVMSGDHEHARALCIEAERAARTDDDQPGRTTPLSGLATALAFIGDVPRAERVLDAVTEPSARIRPLTGIAAALMQPGKAGRGNAMVDEILDYGRSLDVGRRGGWAENEIAVALADAGQVDRAEEFVRETTYPPHTSWYDRSKALCALAAGLTRAGRLDRAERLANRLGDSPVALRVRCDLAASLGRAGLHDNAVRMVRLAEQFPPRFTGEADRRRTAGDLAGAFARAGDLERAEGLSRRITDPLTQTLALSGILVALATAGDREGASATADRAEASARAVTGASLRAIAVSELSVAFAQAGDADRAERTARTIASPDVQARTMVRIATVMARAGDRDRAETCVAAALSAGSWAELPLEEIGALAPEVLACLADGALR
jgi:tetratricopeptide (TPR) repeat protein